MTIDLNCDMGELAADITGGKQEALMAHVTSVNIACGGHAGDRESMRQTVQQALRWKVAVGAHPGYPDPENFGRRALHLPPSAVAEFIAEQVAELAEIAAAEGAQLVHVKAHGALYNQAARNPALAAAIAEGAARVSPHLILVGLAGSVMLDVFRQAGMAAAAEAFADRRYEADGALRARSYPDALIVAPQEAAAQSVQIVREHAVTAVDGTRVSVHAETICIHGDSPGALAIAAAAKRTLQEAGIHLRSLIAS